MTRRARWAWARDRGLDEQELAAELRREDPLWPGQLATLIALLLYLILPSKLTIGPNWSVPAAGIVVLAVLAITGGRQATLHREIALGLVLLAIVANLVAVGFLTHYLLEGGRVRGANLLDGGAIIWTANVLLFSVVYWELDRGGPLRPGGARRPVAPDFLFPEMSAERYAPVGWRPGFVDYLYVSLTNQTAFSPTDTMPLALRVKVLMGIQGVAALITVVIIVARAVSLLG